MRSAIPKKIHNFSAGPSVLPKAVLKQVEKDLINYQGTGISVMEMSHRSKAYTDIRDKAENNLRHLMSIPDNFEVFFLQGGATMQFSSIPINLARQHKKADYCVTGTWSQGSIKEAGKFIEANSIIPNESGKFFTIPETKQWSLNNDSDYLYYCDNETISGVEFPEKYDFPKNDGLVCDASSNFASRAIDWSKHKCVFASAQKNIGPAGLTIVIVDKKEIKPFEKSDKVGLLSDWATIQKSPDKLQNTPASWSIYVAGLVIEHMLKQGGLQAYNDLAKARSKKLYDYIDSTDGYFVNPIDKKYRSRINIPFLLKDETKLKEFLSFASGKGLIELNGHRSVGGGRASLYNALEMESVDALISTMDEFRQLNRN